MKEERENSNEVDTLLDWVTLNRYGTHCFHIRSVSPKNTGGPLWPGSLTRSLHLVEEERAPTPMRASKIESQSVRALVGRKEGRVRGSGEILICLPDPSGVIGCPSHKRSNHSEIADDIQDRGPVLIPDALAHTLLVGTASFMFPPTSCRSSLVHRKT